MYFFFNDTATTEIYTLSLHDALPIYRGPGAARQPGAAGARDAGSGVATAARRCVRAAGARREHGAPRHRDRKSTRLNSSHANISYAVFCLKKNKVNLRLQQDYITCS